MNGLVAISNSHASADLDAHRITSLPVVVISAHNQCDCRCVMCDIWRIKEPQQISSAMFEHLINSFRRLNVRWVAFTGGEPQRNSNLFDFADLLRSERIRVTLLTAGMLLENQAEAVARSFDDLIVSLDGPRDIHGRIRRVPRAFDRLQSGVRAVRQCRPEMKISGRCTVQKANRTALRATIEAARQLGLQSISFLAADVSSTAFHHPVGASQQRTNRVALDPTEVMELEGEIENLIHDCRSDLDSGFIVETADKLRQIPRHFHVSLGRAEPLSPRCNAPWKCAVIDASGDVRPCFFHPPFGNLLDQTLNEILNGTRALSFRADLDIASNPVCQRCVCSLYLPPSAKLA